MADAVDEATRRQIFNRFDANGDGKISSSEIGDTLKTLRTITDDEIKRMMAEIDTDGDGYISYEEFTAFAQANPRVIQEVAKLLLK